MTQNVSAGFDPRLASSGPFIPEAQFNPSGIVILWVNAATSVPEPDQNGSEAAPYSNVNTAADALPDEGGVLMVVQGDYSSQTMSVVGDSPGDKEVRVIGFGARSDSVEIRRVTSDAFVALQNVQINEFVTLSTGDLELRNVIIGGNVTAAGGGNLTDAIIAGAATFGGNVRAVETSFGNTLNGQIIDALGSSFIGTITIEGGESTLRDCTFGAAVPINFTNPGGVLFVDATTYGAALAAGVAVTNGEFRVLDQAQFIDLEINVPALLAGELGYEVTSLIGTAFEHLTTFDPVLCFARADLATAGAGGGFMIAGAYIVSPGNLRMGFVGALVGGPTVFRVVKL